jgi:hypothetical protein
MVTDIRSRAEKNPAVVVQSEAEEVTDSRIRTKPFLTVEEKTLVVQ